MKKIYLAALTLAMTACVSNDDLNPVDNYGYIDLNVSNDPIVETRVTVSDTELSNWNVEVKKGSETKFTGKANQLPNQSFTAGEDYTLTVYNCTEAEATNGYGQARWEGNTKNAFKITEGVASQVNIDCQGAQNSKIGATFNLTDNFSNYKIILDPNTRNLDIANAETFAYFPAGNVTFNFTYDYTDPSGTKSEGKTISGTITCEASKLHTIKITSDESGTIKLSINYDDFTDGGDVELQFNAATGEQVKN